MRILLFKGLSYTLLAGSLLMVSFLIFAWPGENTRSVIQLVPDDTRVVAKGKRIYAEQCASCHGTNLEGQPGWKVRGSDGYLPAPPHDETGHTWHHPDRLLFELTKFGLSRVAGADYQTRMPAYGGVLQDKEIIAVLSFIKASWPAAIRSRHDRLNAAAAKSTHSSSVAR